MPLGLWAIYSIVKVSGYVEINLENRDEKSGKVLIT